ARPTGAPARPNLPGPAARVRACTPHRGSPAIRQCRRRPRSSPPPLASSHVRHPPRNDLREGPPPPVRSAALLAAITAPAGLRGGPGNVASATHSHLQPPFLSTRG